LVRTAKVSFKQSVFQQIPLKFITFSLREKVARRSDEGVCGQTKKP
jgi:hypothetical protein